MESKEVKMKERSWWLMAEIRLMVIWPVNVCHVEYVSVYGSSKGVVPYLRPGPSRTEAGEFEHGCPPQPYSSRDNRTRTIARPRSMLQRCLLLLLSRSAASRALMRGH